MKADRYLFDGSHPCALRKLPCDSKDAHVKKEDILAKTAENLEKMAALQDAFYAEDVYKRQQAGCAFAGIGHAHSIAQGQHRARADGQLIHTCLLYTSSAAAA